LIRAGEIRKGNVIEHKGALWFVLDTKITYSGKRGAYVQVKMQNIADRHIQTVRFSTSDSVEKVFLESKTMTYLYQSGTGYVFMDEATGDQVEMEEAVAADIAPYLAYNAGVEINFCRGQVVEAQLPASVVLEVSKTDPAVRGDTATNVTKPAEMETGLVVKVPGHIQTGEKIRVDTRSGEFLGRA
jgi:elongation factor P